MGTNHTRRLRRPRWRSWLLLARVSNLPTVWTNVIAGAVLSGAAPDWRALAVLAFAVSLLYTAGMVLNDAFDHAIDARARPERPIPTGDVSVFAASTAGGVLLGAGLLLLVWSGPRSAAFVWGLALVAAILYYDYRHKRDPLGPLVMGLCRGLVYCVAAAAAAAVSTLVLAGASAMAIYVMGLTVVARRTAGGRGHLIPRMIAGISLVDAVVVGLVTPWLAPWVALGFFLTLALQRVVPGD